MREKQYLTRLVPQPSVAMLLTWCPVKVFRIHSAAPSHCENCCIETNNKSAN